MFHTNVVRVAAVLSLRHCAPAHAQRCRSAAYSTVKYFTKKHEWVSVDGDVGTVGISKYAQDALGEVVFAQLPNVGELLIAGQECGALESVKAASELYSPVSGTVTEKNSSVQSTPSVINKSCYVDGWLFKLKLTEPEELTKLMDEATYDKYLQDVEH